MHLVFIYQENPLRPIRGTGFYLREVVRALLACGHEVTTVQPMPAPVAEVSAEEGEQQTEGLAGLRRVVFEREPPRWLRWRPGLVWHRLALRQFLRRLHREKPIDAIECMDGYGWLPFGAVPGVPLVVRLHGADFFFHHEENRQEDKFTYWLEKQTIRRANTFVGVSQHVVDVTLRLCHLEHRRADCTVIPNAIDTAHFAPGDPDEVEPGRILFLNSLEERKGFDSLCRAFPLVLEKYPEARLVLAGGITGKRAQEDLQTVLESLPTAARERIELPGWVYAKKKTNELHQAAVCCYPSRSETFGISPAEAMACGKPVIYTKYGPGPELITHGQSGLLCDPADPADIARQLLAILQDATLASKLGRKARERACHQFAPDRVRTLNSQYFLALKHVSPRNEKVKSGLT